MNLDSKYLNENLLTFLRTELNEMGISYHSPPIQVQGGFETRIYRFQLNGVLGEFAQPMILRLYPIRYGSGNAVWESTIQNVLDAVSYPVAKPRLLCTDLAVLGGAFFIMDFLPGHLLINTPMEMIPELLGKTHTSLHRIDPNPLIKSIHSAGINPNLLFLDHRYDFLKESAKQFLWIRKIVDWLIDRRPPEPEQLAICHGDFHPLNILIDDGRVTGVLDWPGFLIADPVLDIANTIMLITIPFKHVAPSLGLDFSTVDFEMVAEAYLAAYQAEKSFESTHLDYYRVRRCAYALIEGAQGQSVWEHHLIVQDLLEFIHSITGISIKVPSSGR